MLASVALAANAGAGRHHARRARVVCVAKANRGHHRGHGARHARKCVPGSKHAKHVRRGAHTKHARPVNQSGHSKQSGQPKETASATLPTSAATIARVLSTSCENTELMPETGNLEAVEQSALCLVNQERARNGELPLALDADLNRAAEGHSAEMVQDDYFAHISPSGETPFQRIEASGYIPNSQVGYTLGENIAWGTLHLATPKAIVAAWIASPEHLANILNATYTETGLGVAPQAPPSLAEGEAGAVYSQEFGAIEG